MPDGYEDLFNLIFDHIHDVVFVLEVGALSIYRFSWVNQRFLDVTGLELAQVIGKLIQDVIPEPAHELVLGKYRQAIDQRMAVRWLETSAYPAGVKTGEVTVVPVFDRQGNCTQLVGTVHDITEHVEARNKLEKLTRQLTGIMESMNEGLVTFDTEMNYTYINARGADLLGCEPEDLIGKNYWEEFPEAKGTPFADAYVRAIQTQEPDSFEAIYEPWGRWFENRLYPSEDGLTIFFWDISDRKRSEIKLERMNKLYAALSECNQMIVRCQSKFEMFERICRISVEYGGMAMAWIGQVEPSAHLVKPVASFGTGTEYLEGIQVSIDADNEYGNGPVGTAMRTGQPTWWDDFQHQSGLAPWSARGKQFGWGSVASLPLFCKGDIVGSLNLYSKEINPFDEQMKKLLIEMAEDISYALGIFHDEAERSEEQTQLHMLSEILRQSPSVVIMTDLNDVIEYANPAFDERYGYQNREVIGKSVHFLQSETSNPAIFDEIRASLERAETWTGELVNVAKDGEEYIESTTAAIVHDSDGRPIKHVYALRNITEQKFHEQERQKLQAQLQHIQKMESVGRLAGGIAHDFNNMLGVIIAYSELALRLTTNEKLTSYLQEIDKAADRSANLTRQLLTFARKQAYEPKVIDPNQAVEDMIKMLARLIGEDIKLSWLPEYDAWPVLVDPSQLDQILANLCVNARDAIKSGGRIIIEIHNEMLDMDYCMLHPEAAPGAYVRLSVSDDGHGIEKELLENIFEPFFTTKQMGEGTGLGLSTVYGIVEQSNGFINVYSEPGHGTTFNIYLPRHGGETTEADDNVLENAFAIGTETILLVEDEVAILEAACLTLEGCGYSVLHANSPEAALHIAESHAGKIHMLVTDIIMPGMNVKELTQTLLSSYPGMRCLFMSGYSGNAITHHGILDEGVSFIQKPFSMATLTAKVRQILDS